MERRRRAAITAAFLFVAACSSTPPEQPQPQQPPAAEPTARPTLALVPTTTPVTDPYIYDEQRRAVGWRGQRKLPSGQSVEEYCKIVYNTQDPIINGSFCSTDPPTEEAANQVYEEKRRAYDESKNRPR
jgi:hypothetical protein